jgi:hypothetical protein
VAGRTVKLTWQDKSPNESGFYLERAAKAKTLQFSRVATIGAGVSTYTRTETAGTWMYRVQAYNSAGASSYSNTATLRVK